MLRVVTSEADQTKLSGGSMPLLELEESFLTMSLNETVDISTALESEDELDSNVTVSELEFEEEDYVQDGEAGADTKAYIPHDHDGADFADAVDEEETDFNQLLEDVSLESQNYFEDKLPHIEKNTSDQIQMGPEEEPVSNLADCKYVAGADDEVNTVNAFVGYFGFMQFRHPPTLCRHPKPATGRDDDIYKIREVLDDVLLKSGNLKPEYAVGEIRILFGPDNKIGKSLIDLMKQNCKYKRFLPEFPILHLRKSKITNLFAAYKEAGLLLLLKFMVDDSEKMEWSKLMSAESIDTATRMVWRISMSIHLALFVRFLQYVPSEESEIIVNLMETSGNDLGKILKDWDDKFQCFIPKGCEINATFALHVEMVKHCDQVIAIALAEHMGGPDGYHLLLSAMKSSLPFAFLNGATSYAGYCANLLYYHYSAGVFHRNMKYTLFSTPETQHCEFRIGYAT